MWSLQCKVRSVKCGVWSVKCRVWGVKCGVWSAKGGVWSRQCDTPEVLRLPRKMTLDTSKVLLLPRKLQLILRKRGKSIAPASQSNFRHAIKQVGMSQSPAPATQNDMTTCLENFEKEKFCSSPRRHGEATGKPETRDETRGKASISCETSSNFHTL